MRTRSLVLSRLRIRPGEGRRVALMIVYSAAAMGGVHTVGKSVASALFLSRLPESAIPYLFILPGIATTVALLLYSAVAGRYPLNHVVVGSAAAVLLCVLIFRAILFTSLGSHFAVLAALFVVIDLATTLVLLQFWTYAGEVFDVLEARRLFGLIAVGGTVSNIVAGLTLRQLAGLVGVDNLLFAVALSLAVCAVCGWALGREHDETRRLDAHGAGDASLKESVVELTRSPLLRSIGLLTALVAVLVSVGTYEFFLSVRSHYAGKDAALVGFLGAFQIWAGLAALVVQVDLTGRIMGRLGAIGALLAFPFGMAATAAASLATGGGLASITAIRGADPVLRHTINQAGMNVLYLPTPGRLSRRAKELHGVCFAVALAAIGLVFLGLRSVSGWTYADWAYVTFAIAVLWVVVLVRTRRQYVRTLARAVGLRQLELNSQPVDLDDETTASVLVAALRDANELRVVHALQLIGQAPSRRWNPELVRLLDHPSSAVACQALAILGETGTEEERAPVEAQLGASEVPMRLAALEALSVLGGEATARVRELLDDPHPAIRAKAAALLPGGAAELGRMLESSDVEVRCAAIRAAGSLGALDLVPELVLALADPQTAAAAGDALAELGPECVPQLAAALADRKRQALARPMIPRVLERIGTADCAALLLARISDADEAVASAAQRGLANLRRLDPSTALAEGPVRDALTRELRRCYALSILRADLGADADDPLLDDALRARTARALDRVFLLLACLHPDRHVERARHALDSERKSARALAVELVVNLAERRVEDLLLALVDAPFERVVELAERRLSLERRSAVERLAELAQGEDRWLAACAVRRIGLRGPSGLGRSLDYALGSSEPLVRETAVAAAALLGVGSA